MNGSAAPYQNGTPVPTQRHQFRRQGSSYGPGHVHNMAVMVAPPKVDYSLQKGGLKSWAVMLVFVLLCSALLAIFSEADEELVEQSYTEKEHEYEPIITESDEVDDEEETPPVDIADVEEEEDEDEEQQLFTSLLNKAKKRLTSWKRPAILATADEDDDDGDEDVVKEKVNEKKIVPQKRRPHRNLLNKQDEKADDETQPKKATVRIKTTTTATPVVEEEDEDEDEDDDSDEVAGEKVADDDGDDDSDEENEEVKKEEEKPKPIETKEKSRSKKIVVEEPDDDEDDDDDDKSDEKADDDDDDNDEDEEEEEEPLPRHVIRRQQKRLEAQQRQAEKKKMDKEKAKAKSLKKKPVESEEDDDDDDHDHDDDQRDDEDDEDDDDEDDDGSDEVLVKPKQHREPRRPIGRTSWHSSLQAKRMAEDSKNPRKWLLKGKQRKMYPKLEDPLPPGDDDNDDDDDDDDDDEDSGIQSETENANAEVRELAATRKKTQHYNRKAITNRQDYKHRSKLDMADYLVEKHDFQNAVAYYNEVLKEYKDSPRAHFGLARIFQIQAEEEDQDANLDKAIVEYQRVLDEYDAPDELFKESALNLVEAARFRGNLHKVMTVQRELIDRFPADLDAQTDFGITFLMMGRPEEARKVFESVMETDAAHPVANAYYGYLLKVYDADYERGVFYMRKGLKAQEQPALDAKFYIQLGDGLTRLGRELEAVRVYEEAVELGFFPSVYQRSTHNLDGLAARPWWTLAQTMCARQLRHLERQWTVVRAEALHAWLERRERFVAEEAARGESAPRALVLRRDGAFDAANCRLAPATCRLLREFGAESRCDKGEFRISVLTPSSRVGPRCGPTNFVLQAHLGLVSPSEARIRVGREVRGWRTGKFLVFDESFEHEVWFEGAASNAVRIVLTLELWHPEVPLQVRSEQTL